MQEQLFTVGQLADRFGVSNHQLKYAIDQYRIEPTTRVGIIRVWSEEKIPQIRNALDRIAGNKGGRWQ